MGNRINSMCIDLHRVMMRPPPGARPLLGISPQSRDKKESATDACAASTVFFDLFLIFQNDPLWKRDINGGLFIEHGLVNGQAAPGKFVIALGHITGCGKLAQDFAVFIHPGLFEDKNIFDDKLEIAV